MKTKTIPGQHNSASIDQIYNHPNWRNCVTAEDIEHLLHGKHKQFLVTSDVCGPQESQTSVQFVIYFLDDQKKVKTGRVSLDPENPEKWFHKNQNNIRTRDISEVFQHVLDFRNCPQYVEAKFK